MRFRSPCFLGLAVAAVLSLLSGCSPGSAADHASEESGAPAALAYARGRVDIEGGLIRLASSYDGLVREVRVEEGERVRAGQVLAVIDDRRPRLALAIREAELVEARAALGPLMARLAAAEREASRVGPQVDDGALPSSEADTAGDRVNELRAELEAARAAVLTATARVAADEFEIAQHSIRAPLDGRIVRRGARPGDGVSTLNVTPLFLFAPDASRIVRADLDERFVERVRPGQRAEIVIENEDTAPRVLGGRVLRVGEVFGERLNPPEPGERVDVRAVECVFSLDDQTVRVGQRVMARVLP